MTVVATFAVVTPVVASLAAAVRWALDHPKALRAMRVAAREEYVRRYTAEANYEQLMTVCRDAAARRAERHRN